MGIHGVYKEIGPGERIALSRLAVEHFERTGRSLRIAVDISIWLFQIQSGKGGTNPALRTFYYRLLRLISLSIHPLFVFDGPNKPPFKRNKRTGPNVASIPEFLAKQLLKQFGLPFHLAPGEAEAECALLQREGVVDAVLSEDVDTLMFGSGITLRNWSPELKSSKVPTHVNLYDAEKTKSGPAGLDREGMILVALMSGGDYIPEGVPGCGPKLACEAARAGFGKDLCNISRKDKVALRAWRERLAYELRTNESKLFARKRSALVIPDDFPNPEVLGYYTHPAVTSADKVAKLRDSLRWNQELDIPSLRTFTAEAFDWVKLGGAKKFIRNLAPALLVRQLRQRAERNGSSAEEPETIQREEAELVQTIHGKRNHVTTDNTTELRIGFIPINLVKLDLDAEEPDDELPEEASESEEAVGAQADENGCLDVPGSPTKKRAPSQYDPTVIEKVWVMETFVKVGVPLKVQDWEESFRNPQTYMITKAATKRAEKAGRSKRATAKDKADLERGTLNRFTRATKPGVSSSQTRKAAKSPETAEFTSIQTHIERLSSQSLSPVRAVFHAAPPAPNSPQRNTRSDAIIDLLSSPEPHLSPKQFSAESVSHIVDLPSTVTKRRRSPLRRALTVPSETSYQSLSAAHRPSTPPPLDTLAAINLDSSPFLPSPSRIQPPKRTKASTKNFAKDAITAAVASNRNQVQQQLIDIASLSDSPHSHQSTIHDWIRRSQSVTPSKARHADRSSPNDLVRLTPPDLVQARGQGQQFPLSSLAEELDPTGCPKFTSVVPQADGNIVVIGRKSETIHVEETHFSHETSDEVSPMPVVHARQESLTDKWANTRSTKRKPDRGAAKTVESKVIRVRSTVINQSVETLALDGPQSAACSQPQKQRKKQEVKLRDSLEGAWKLSEAVDLTGDSAGLRGDIVGTSSSPGRNKATMTAMRGGRTFGANTEGKTSEAQRRAWRVSEVEVLDLTGS